MTTPGHGKKDATAELTRLATLADAQGRTQIAAVCQLALRAIADLRAELAAQKASRATASRRRAQTLGAAKLSELGRAAANRRWVKHTS